MITKQQLKQLFKEPLDMRLDEKWLTIGFFTGIIVFFSILFPLAIYQSILENIGFIPIKDVATSLILFKGLIVITPMIGYLTIWWILKENIVTFSVNIGILMWRDYQKSKIKKTNMEILQNVE